MIQQNEMIMVLLGAAVLLYLAGSRHRIKRIPSWRTLVFSFCVLMVGWVLTVLEGFFWGDVMNLLEHVCYAACSVLVAVWCRAVFRNKKEVK